MANFIPTEHIQRARRFETIQRATATVLAGVALSAFEPTIRPVVEQLPLVNAEALLPNIDCDGVATLTKSQLATDSLVVIPLLHDKEVITASPSVLRSTPGRIRRTAEQYGMSERRARLLSNFFLMLSIAELKTVTYDAHQKGVIPGAAMVTQYINGPASTGLFAGKGRPFCARSRSVIIVPAATLEKSAPIIGMSQAHEYVHGIDVQDDLSPAPDAKAQAMMGRIPKGPEGKSAEERLEKLIQQIMDQEAAKSELRGYHVSATIAELLKLDPHDPPVQTGSVIERLRLLYATKDDPFPCNDRIIQRLREWRVIV